MTNVKLFTSVAVAALIAGAPAAFAQDVTLGNQTQSPTNSGNVTVDAPGGGSSGGGPGNSGTGNVGLTITAVTGDGAASPFKGTGASAAVAETFINLTGNFTVGDITQDTSQNGDVTVDGSIEGPGAVGVTGLGASVSISTTGAASSAGSTFIGSTGTTTFGNVDQTTAASGNVRTGTDVNLTEIRGSGGFPVSGAGASVAISTTGAVSSVALTGIQQDQNAAQSVGDVTQDTTKSGGRTQSGIFNGFNSIEQVGDVGGTGASVSISATGAQSSVSVTQIESTNTSAQDTTVGNVNQTSVNSGPSNNGVQIGAVGIGGSTPVTISGDGASVSASVTGAASSVSARFIQSTETATLSFGPEILQNTTNSAGINGAFSPRLNDDFDLGDIEGDGASFSLSATGAVSSVGVTTINSGDVAGTPDTFIGQTFVTQTTTNTGDLFLSYDDSGRTAAGDIIGNGASFSVSGTGAASAVSITGIGDLSASSLGRDYTVGDVTQTTGNEGEVRVETGTDVHTRNTSGPEDNVLKLDAGELVGAGASVALSAAGANSSLSARFIASDEVGSVTVGNVIQGTTNSGDVFLTFADSTTGDLSGAGSSVSANVTGAASSVALASIENINVNGTSQTLSYGTINQTTTNTGTTVTTDDPGTTSGDANSFEVGELSGSATSVSISATGAISAVSISAIDAAQSFGSVEVDTITQGATGPTGATNDAAVTNRGTISTGGSDLTGAGASASISASGAVNSVSSSSVNAAGGLGDTNFSDVTQTSTNNATATVDNSGNITVGNLTGSGTSAAISSTGALAAISGSRIDTGASLGLFDVDAVNQTVVNDATVTTSGKITADDLSGTGSQASVSATGAAANVSVSSINTGGSIGTTNVGNVTQTVDNTANVSTSGSVTAGTLSGNGATVGVSATGASTFSGGSAINPNP